MIELRFSFPELADHDAMETRFRNSGIPLRFTDEGPRCTGVLTQDVDTGGVTFRWYPDKATYEKEGDDAAVL